MAVIFPQTHLVCDFLLKFAGLLTAISVAIATIGIPLPIPFVKDTTVAFPCMNCGCGCLNAEMCWRQCCCYTHSQKIAWAESHGVTVPAEVAKSVVSQAAEDLESLKPCCRVRRQACQEKTRNNPHPSADDVEGNVVPGVLAIHALKCQGNSLSLTMLPPSVPVAQMVGLLPLSRGASLSLAETRLYQPPFFDAVVPPPEFAVL